MLSIKQLSYRYKNTSEEALSGINLDIPEGEIFGLLGPNGAGKTTLLSLIGGTLRNQQGAIAVRGELPPDWRRYLSVVPQEYSFYPMLTLQENLVFFGKVQGLRGEVLKSRMRQAVDVTGLEQNLHKLAGHCSGGLKRRLNLAIGLLNDPKLLLLDEPTVGVDPQSRAFILEAIRQLAAAGKTIIYTSHYMEEVQYLCQQVAIIDCGHVLLAGELSSLLDQHMNAQVELRVNELSSLQQTSINTSFPKAYCAENKRIALPFSADRLSQLLAWCVEQSVEVKHIHYGAQDLESLFLALTKRSLRD